MKPHPFLHSFAYSLDFLREQVADVADADMTRQPPGVRNHPAWIIGHLTLICQEIGGVVGLDAWLPAHWPGRYGAGSQPAADTAAYEPRLTLLAMLQDAQERLTAAVAALDDGRLDQPFPDPALHEVFPTVRHALVQVLVGHTAYHVGELAVWRHAMGLPRLGRSYE